MKENKNIQIKLVVNKKEHEQIQNNARASGKTVSAYIRELALNMCLIELDTSHITKHTTEISSYRNAINQLIFTIKKTGNYTPADLEYIVDTTNEILKSEKEFLNIYKNSIESEKKLIARNIRQIVKENIKKDK